jgi:hypothetical protein
MRRVNPADLEAEALKLAVVAPRWVMAVLALALAGCGPVMSPEQCRTADWRARGAEDGRHGKREGSFDRYATACAGAGVSPDPEAWEAGRREGFCSADRGYAMGRGGGDYDRTCAEREWGEGRFLEAYARGLVDRRTILVNDIEAQSTAGMGMEISRQSGDDLFRRRMYLLSELQRTNWLLAQIKGQVEVTQPRLPPATVGRLLAHLVAGDPELERSARTLWATGDTETLRSASARLMAAARAVEGESAKEQDARLSAILEGMAVVGGAAVLAYCFDLAAAPSALSAHRKAALVVLERQIPAGDAAARARAAALRETVNHPSAPPAATGAP